MKRSLLAALFVCSAASSQAFAMQAPAFADEAAPLLQRVEYPCGEGYHLGRGGQECWSNTPGGPSFSASEAPGYRNGMWAGNGCPPGYHPGRGGQRCWKN